MHTPAQNRTNIGSEKDATSKECCTMCVYPQPLILLLLTLLMTISATVMLSVAIMTDHWEHVTWNSLRLAKITNNSMDVLEWVFDGKVGILHQKKNEKKLPPIFLVPMHGGIWTLCIDLTSLEIHSLKRYKKFPINIVPCVNYLGGSIESENRRNDWRHSELQQTTLQPHLRMQNLSISCSLVCLIILGSAALVGTFGICRRQISAILITGIMYLLAALFALFTLMIIHYKRQQGRLILENDIKSGTVDGLVGFRGSVKTQHLLEARIIITSWSLDLGWGGVVLCSITSVMWILLSKLLRYNPISTFVI